MRSRKRPEKVRRHRWGAPWAVRDHARRVYRAGRREYAEAVRRRCVRCGIIRERHETLGTRYIDPTGNAQSGVIGERAGSCEPARWERLCTKLRIPQEGEHRARA